MRPGKGERAGTTWAGGGKSNESSRDKVKRSFPDQGTFVIQDNQGHKPSTISRVLSFFVFT